MNEDEGKLGRELPKQTTGLRGDEVNAIGMRPLIDFELLTEGNTREDDNLRDLRHSRVTRHVGERRTHLKALYQIERDFLSWGAGEESHWDVGVEFS